MHNANQPQAMQMPDPRLHHNMQNADPRQAHTIQNLDPRSSNNLQNARPENTLQSLDPRLASLSSATSGNEQRDTIGQKRDRPSDLSSSMTSSVSNKISVTEKMITNGNSNINDIRAGHCATCNCQPHQNEMFPMREPGI
jgi:hypothetical protein